MPKQAKRSLAQRMRDRGRDLDVAEDYMNRGKAPPKVGGVRAPKPLSSRKPKKR